jgi:hypothetical protein
MYTTNLFTSPLKKVLSCIPVNPDSDVVFHQLPDYRQDRCGTVNPVSQDFTENKIAATFYKLLEGNKLYFSR